MVGLVLQNKLGGKRVTSLLLNPRNWNSYNKLLEMFQPLSFWSSVFTGKVFILFL